MVFKYITPPIVKVEYVGMSVRLVYLYIPIVADSVNRGISTARRMRAAYTIGLSINKDLKLRKRKGRDK